jgi:predicted ester cyclase
LPPVFTKLTQSPSFSKPSDDNGRIRRNLANPLGDAEHSICEDKPVPSAAPTRCKEQQLANEENKRVYARYVELLNAQDFASLPEVVDPERYREICVGFTPGWVDLPEAIASLEKVVGGIPDLHARIDDVAAEGDRVYARLTVTGTNTGRFFGAPPTGRGYEASMFDYARLEDGRIVERIQQSDTLSQLRQMYSGAAKKIVTIALVGLTTLIVLRGRKGRAAGAKSRAGDHG